MRLYVRRSARPEHVGIVALPGDDVGVAGGAVEPRVAIVGIGFAPHLDTGGDSDIAAGKREQAIVADLEIGGAERGPTDPVHIDQEGADRRRIVRGRIADRIIGLAAPVERIVGVRSRAGERLLEKRVADRPVRIVVGLRPGIGDRRVEMEGAEVAAEAAEKAEHVVGDGEGARASVDRAIIGQSERQACGGHSGQAGQAVGIGNPVDRRRAERVPVIAGGDADRCAGHRRRLLALAVEDGMIIAGLAEEFDSAEIVGERGEGVDPVEPAADRAVGILVIAKHAVVDPGDGARLEAEVAAIDGARAAGGGVAGRLDMEHPRGRQGGAVLAYRGRRRNDRERTPGRRGRAIVESGVAFPRRADQGGAVVLARGIVAFARHQRRPVEIGAEHHHPAILADPGAGFERDGGFAGAVCETIAAVDPDALIMVVEHDIDDARDRVRSVNGAGAVAKHLDPAGRPDRKGIGVDGLDRDEILRLRARGRHHSAAVEKDEGVARAEIAQVDRGIVAARVVEVAGGAGFLELDVAGLRDRAEQIVTRKRTGRSDPILADHRHRQSAGRLCATDLASDDDDLLALGSGAGLRIRGLGLLLAGLNRGRVGLGIGRRGLRRGGAAEQRSSGEKSELERTKTVDHITPR